MISRPPASYPSSCFESALSYSKYALSETFLQDVTVLMLVKEAENSSDILRGKPSLEINFFILPSVSMQVLMFAD